MQYYFFSHFISFLSVFGEKREKMKKKEDPFSFLSYLSDSGHHLPRFSLFLYMPLSSSSSLPSFCFLHRFLSLYQYLCFSLAWNACLVYISLSHSLHASPFFFSLHGLLLLQTNPLILTLWVWIQSQSLSSRAEQFSRFSLMASLLLKPGNVWRRGREERIKKRKEWIRLQEMTIREVENEGRKERHNKKRLKHRQKHSVQETQQWFKRNTTSSSIVSPLLFMTYLDVILSMYLSVSPSGTLFFWFDRRRGTHTQYFAQRERMRNWI